MTDNNKQENNLKPEVEDVSADEKIVSNSETNLESQAKQCPSIYIRSLNIVREPLQRRYARHYKESKKHLVIDLIFAFLIILLIIINIILFTKSFPIENFELKINSPQVSGQQDEQAVEEIKDTLLILKPAVVYYTAEGEQLGVGPWPPVMGEQSFVRVFIDLQTSLHNVSNLILKAKLPSNIKWADKAVVDSGQPVVYDQASNLISWNLETLKVNSPAQLSFEIEIQPMPEDLNKKIKLLEDLSVTAYDLVSDKSVSGYASDVYSPQVVE